jgi:energy-coupling factor transporter ATP-binding protein EcfA2
MDLSALIAAAQETGCVAIEGVQGAGKSRLACALAGQLPAAEVVPDCVLAVDLRGRPRARPGDLRPAGGLKWTTASQAVARGQRGHHRALNTVAGSLRRFHFGLRAIRGVCTGPRETTACSTSRRYVVVTRSPENVLSVDWARGCTPRLRPYAVSSASTSIGRGRRPL